MLASRICHRKHQEGAWSGHCGIEIPTLPHARRGDSYFAPGLAGETFSARGLTLRLAFSSTGGRLLAGTPGAAVAGAAALSSAFVGSRLRTKVRGRGPELGAALFEDALSYSLVLTAAASLR